MDSLDDTIEDDIDERCLDFPAFVRKEKKKKKDERSETNRKNEGYELMN